MSLRCRHSSRLLLLSLLATLLLLSTQIHALTSPTAEEEDSPSLDALEQDLSLLESEAAIEAPDVPSSSPPSSASPSSSALTTAQSYSSAAIAQALAQSQSLLSEAKKEGEKEAAKAGPTPLTAEDKKENAKLEEKLLAQAKADAAAAELAEKKAAELRAAAEKRRIQKLMMPFRSYDYKSDAKGVFGGVEFGMQKKDSIPSAAPSSSTTTPRTATRLLDRLKKNIDIYGAPKSCLKDIAAHFDELDIYESKKLSLLQRMSETREEREAQMLKAKLSNLESWHHIMQKRFLASSKEGKGSAEQVKTMEALFSAHLPSELQSRLAQNKKAAEQDKKEPFPEAHTEAMKYLREKRREIAKQEELYTQSTISGGRKKMIRPNINNPEFPSVDPISSILRERIWRQVKTTPKMSVDRREMEAAQNVVDKAHKAHGDFVEGPIAGPILKGKLYEPDTNRLGEPNFMHNFPYGPTPEPEITMDDKVKVEQKEHQTW